MCGSGEACMAGGHAWWGVCMAGGHVWWGGVRGRGACMAGGCAWQEERQLQRAVRILLECILVVTAPKKNSPHANWLQIGEYSDLVHLVLFGAESTHKV